MTDYTRTRGDTYADIINVKDSSLAVVNITGYSFKLTVDTLENPTDSATQVYQLTGSITDAPNGVVQFAPTALQADQRGDLYFDIEMTDGAGKITTIDKGSYTYTQDITK